MPVPYIRDPDIKTSDPHPGPSQNKKTPDHHRSPTTRVLLVCRLPPPYDSLGPGPARRKLPLAIPSTIVKGHFHSVLVSNILVTSLSVGSAPMVSQWLFCKTCIFRRIFSGTVLALIILGAFELPVHWYHLFVPV